MDGTQTSIHLGPLFDLFAAYVVPALVTIIGGLLTAAITELKNKWKWQGWDSLNNILQSAVTNAAGLALNRIKVAGESAVVTTSHPAVAEAADYVIKNAPQVLARLGLTPDDVRQKIVAKIGTMQATPEPVIDVVKA